MFTSSIVLLGQSDNVVLWLFATFWPYVATAVGAVAAFWLCFRYIPNNSVGVVEKLWSHGGSVPEGQIIALDGEAGYQAELVRGGMHFGYWRWQYRVHKVRLVTISQGKIGYVYARDGEPLLPSQTLGRRVECNNFQDARTFLMGYEEENGDKPRGQRGRQRAILREGVYAINPAVFVAIAEDHVFALPAIQSRQELRTIEAFRVELGEIGGFDPVVVGGKIETVDHHEPDWPTMVDSIGIVTVHDGPSLPPDEIIAPIVGSESQHEHFHNNFQDAEAFLRAGGRRGRQYQTITDGTYFINRWFATLEMIPKTVVPIGYVGDIECVDVLIGKPDHIETLLEQLRQRQLSTEQLETFERRKAAATKLQDLKAAEAQADMQTALTNAQMEARIAENHGEAELARSRKQAEQTIVVAEAALGRARREAEQRVVLAEAESRERMLAGRGESQRVMQIGLSEAAVLARKISSFGDPRLYAVNEVADRLAHSEQPLVPQRLFITSGHNGDEKSPQSLGLMGTLLSLLVAERSGFQSPDRPEPESLKALIDQMGEQAVDNMKDVMSVPMKSLTS